MRGDGSRQTCFTCLVVILCYTQYLRPCTNIYLVLVNIGDNIYKTVSTGEHPRVWGNENWNMKMDLTLSFLIQLQLQSWTNIMFETCKALISRM